MTSPVLSFEVSPPRTDKSRAAFSQTLRALATLNPAFITVTNGAGGSDKEGTVETAVQVQAETGIPTAAHITYGTLSKGELWMMTEALWDAGIRRLVAIHGDTPPGWQKPDERMETHYTTAESFIYEARREHDFDITVAGDLSRPNVLDNLQGKEGAGANRALTQFFFDNRLFHRFREKAAHAIQLEVIPGLHPVMNSAEFFARARKWGVSVPEEVETRFKDGAGEYLEADVLREASSTFLAEQLRDLASHGVPRIHIYTLNNTRIVLDACRKAGFVEMPRAEGHSVPSIPGPAGRNQPVYQAHRLG